MPLLHGGILRIEFSLALVDVILSLVAFGHSCRIASTCAKENSILRIPPCGKATVKGVSKLGKGMYSARRLRFYGKNLGHFHEFTPKK